MNNLYFNSSSIESWFLKLKVSGFDLFQSKMRGFILLLFPLFILQLGQLSAKNKEDAFAPVNKLRNINKELQCAILENDSNAMGRFYIEKAVQFGIASDFEKAVQNLFKAQQVLKNTNNAKLKAYTYVYLSNYADASLEKRLSLLDSALAIYNKEYPYPDLLVRIWSSYGFVYGNVGGMFDSAMVYMQKTRDIALAEKDTFSLVTISANIAHCHLQLGNYTAALIILKDVMHYKQDKYAINLLTAKFNLLETFHQMENYDSVFFYYQKFKNEFLLRPKIELNGYQLLSEVCEETNKIAEALHYHKKADSVAGILNQKSSNSLIELLELEHASEIKDQEVEKLLANQQRDQNRQMSLMLTCMLLVSVGAGIFFWNREKNRKNQEIHRNTTLELQNTELQNQVLKEELTHSNKELSSFAASIVQNGDELCDLRAYANAAARETNPEKAHQQLRELNQRINHLSHKESTRSEILRRTKEIDQALFFFLKSNYPDLNENELNLMILLMIKFSSKEIATLYNIEEASANTKRYRLRKKLGIRDRASFDSFIEKVMADFDITHKNK